MTVLFLFFFSLEHLTACSCIIMDIIHFLILTIHTWCNHVQITCSTFSIHHVQHAVCQHSALDTYFNSSSTVHCALGTYYDSCSTVHSAHTVMYSIVHSAPNTYCDSCSTVHLVQTVIHAAQYTVHLVHTVIHAAQCTVHIL